MSTKIEIPEVEDARKDTYYTTVVLSEDRVDHFQFVYASQIYGTFFGIYAKFDIRKDGTRAMLKKIRFRIINYKGVINIGITGIKTTYKNPNNNPRRVIEFTIKLQGLRNPLLDFIYNPKDNTEFLESGHKLKVGRLLESFVGKDRNDLFNSRGNGAFDEEFYFRDGLFPIDHKTSDLEDEIGREYPELIDIREYPELIDNNNHPDVGIRCPKTIIGPIIC